MNKNIQIALTGITLVGITFGLLTPVTVILLEKSNVPSHIIGFITTVNYIPFVVVSSFTGKLINKYGVKNVLMLGLVALIVGVIGHIFWQNYSILFPIRVLTGLGSTFIFVSTEVLINTVSDETNRGRNIGLYVVLLSTGIAIGTLLIWTVEIYDWLPFGIGALMMLLVLILQHFKLVDERISGNEEIREKFNFRQIPVIAIISSFIYGVFESSVFVALPLFYLRKEFNTSEVSYLLSSLVLGGIVLLYLLSKFSDRFSKYKILLMISLLLSLLFISPLVTVDIIVLLLAFFIIGGLLPAYYTVGLVYTMEKVDKEFIAQSNGYYIMFYGIGTLIGPILGAMLTDLSQNSAYWIFSSVVCFLFLFVFTFKGIMIKK